MTYRMTHKTKQTKQNDTNKETSRKSMFVSLWGVFQLHHFRHLRRCGLFDSFIAYVVCVVGGLCRLQNIYDI